MACNADQMITAQNGLPLARTVRRESQKELLGESFGSYRYEIDFLEGCVRHCELANSSSFSLFDDDLSYLSLPLQRTIKVDGYE